MSSRDQMAVPVDSSARHLITGASGKLGQFVLKHLLDTLLVTPTTMASPHAVSTLNAADQQQRATSSVGSPARKPPHPRWCGGRPAHIVHVAPECGRLDGVHRGRPLGDRAVAQREQRHRVRFARNGYYFDNSIFILAAKRSGKWFSATKDGKLAGISRDDLALANAVALASGNFENQRYDWRGRSA